MRLAALVSGGKDSLYAAWLAKKGGDDIACFVSFVSENPESYMFHTPNVHLVGVIAESAGVPLLKVPTKGEKESELEDIKRALKTLGTKIDGIVCGAIASKYQMSRIERIAADLGLACVAPLWQRDQEEVLKDEIRDGFRAIVVHVAAAGLDESWLGRELNEPALSELLKFSKKHRFSPVGEGGEFETLVLDCPLFSKRIKVLEAKKTWDAKTRSGTLEIKKAELIEK